MCQRLCLVHVKYFPEMLFSRKENVFKLFGCLGIHFTENQFRCLVRSNILRKMLSVLRKIKLCNQNRKTKRRENLINHSTASNGKVKSNLIQPNSTLTFSHQLNRPTKETKPRKKKFIKSGQIERRRKRERQLGSI